MSVLSDNLAADRALRDAALENFQASLLRVKSGLDARKIGGRMADSVKQDMTELFEYGIETADRNRGIVAAMVVAALLWTFRNPVLDALGGLFADHPGPDAAGGNPETTDNGDVA